MYYTTIQPKDTTVSQQVIMCARTFPTLFFPNQSSLVSCIVQLNQWVAVSMTSNYTSGVSLWFTPSGSNTSQLVYNQTGTKESPQSYCCYVFQPITVPVVQSGTLAAKISNYAAELNPVSAILYVYAQDQTVVPIPSPTHPYRLDGIGVLGFSSLAIFMLVWNPNNVTTRGLNSLSKRIRRNRSI